MLEDHVVGARRRRQNNSLIKHYNDTPAFTGELIDGTAQATQKTVSMRQSAHGKREAAHEKSTASKKPAGRKLMRHQTVLVKNQQHLAGKLKPAHVKVKEEQTSNVRSAE